MSQFTGSVTLGNRQHGIEATADSSRPKILVDGVAVHDE